MPSHDKVAQFLCLPELKLTSFKKDKIASNVLQVKKISKFEVCPKCATASAVVYDHRIVRLKDAPVRGQSMRLSVKKRRFFCKKCRKPFTEPVQGVGKGHRTTHRYRKALLWACENYSDLKRVRKAFRCSSGFIYKILYEQVELRLKNKLNYNWPSTIGIDEHFFTRRRGRSEFVTVFTDFNNKRLREVAFGKVKAELITQISNIGGRENVKNAVIDMSDGYRSLIKEHFPNAQIIADKFHVLRLLSPAINKHRVGVIGDDRKNPVRRLLLRNRNKLLYFERDALDLWLKDKPDLREIYYAKEALHSFYRTKGVNRASRALTRLTDALAKSKLPELKRFRRTLKSWRKEILAYFENRLTNARTEGFNNVAKLVQKRAYGYRSFENYRLRLLHACL
jgi:transposase